MSLFKETIPRATHQSNDDQLVAQAVEKKLQPIIGARRNKPKPKYRISDIKRNDEGLITDLNVYEDE